MGYQAPIFVQSGDMPGCQPKWTIARVPLLYEKGTILVAADDFECIDFSYIPRNLNAGTRKLEM